MVSSYIETEEYKKNKNEICEAEVRKNIVLAELGRPLTLPLARLNRSCEFKKEWNKIQNKWHGQPKEVKERMKTYYQRPEVKERKKTYNKTYNQRPEVKERKKKTPL